MDKKQKTLLVVTLAAFGYLGYQVYGLVSQDVSNQANNGTGSVQTAQAAPRMANAQEAIPRTESEVPKPTQLQSQPLVKGQKAYLNMVNQYELAKMKRRLLEERAAIAAAQHRIATLNKQTRSIDDSLLEQPTAGDSNALNAHSETSYQLSYLDNQSGRWTATLNRAGHYHEVSVGTELPDGAKILKIDRQGVTLKENGHDELVTFNGVVPVVPTKMSEKVSEQATPKKAVETDETVISTNTIEAAAQKALLNAGLLPKKKEATEKAEQDIASKQTQHKTTIPVKKEERDIVVAQNDVLKHTTMPAHPVVPAKAKVKPEESIKDLGPANAKTLLAKASPPMGLDKKVHYTEDEHRLLRLPSHDYTIQLIGSYHRDIVEDFAIANDLGNAAMQFHVKNRGHLWYMLLYGSYQTQKQAQNALRQLPPNLTPERPWIRRVADVQRDIRKRRNG